MILRTQTVELRGSVEGRPTRDPYVFRAQANPPSSEERYDVNIRLLYRGNGITAQPMNYLLVRDRYTKRKSVLEKHGRVLFPPRSPIDLGELPPSMWMVYPEVSGYHSAMLLLRQMGADVSIPEVILADTREQAEEIDCYLRLRYPRNETRNQIADEWRKYRSYESVSS